MIVSLLGGVGLFLLGMVLMTDALKALAGGALRSVLTRFVSGPVSGLASGAVVTTIVQSSSATTVTTIGFVSAGLLTFPQAVGVVFGANLGSTSTGWIVTLLGFKLSIGAVALPVVFAGVAAKLLGNERVAHAGVALAGFGLLFVGLDTLQDAMAGAAARIDPAALPGGGLGGRALLVLVGLVMTVLMQSSSAAVATTLVALNQNAITLDQAAALVVGQNIGTTVTAAIASIGASTAAKRTALAHILFNVVAAVPAFFVLTHSVELLEAVFRRVDDDPGALTLAAFHTLFQLLGLAILLPCVGPFSRLITRVLPDRGPRLTRHLDASVARLGPVALEAARRTTIEIGAEVIEAVRAAVGGDTRRAATSERLRAADEAIEETRRFVSLVATGAQPVDQQRRTIATLHALDHLDRLIEGSRELAYAGLVRRAAQLADGASRLAETLGAAAAWLRDPGGGAAPIAHRLREVSEALAGLRKRDRVRLFEQAAQGGISPEQANELLTASRWMDRVGYHVWRAVHHLHERPVEEGRPAPEAFSESEGPEGGGGAV